jgi:Transcription factor Pcc1
MQATITLEYNDSKTAAAVAEAISPDNSIAPTGLKVMTQRQGACVVTTIKLEGKTATLIATIDDLLESVATAEKALHVIRAKTS